MYRSINKGESWEQKSVGLPNDEVSGLLNYTPYVFCCYKNAGIYRTDDQGNSWSEVTSTIPNFLYYSLAKTSYNSLLAATSGGVFKSDYQGLEWNKLTNSIAHLLISSITIAANGNIIAGSDGGGIYTSGDQGLSWNQNSILNTDNDYEFNHIQKNSNNDIFAAVHGYLSYNSLYKSTDQGISWAHIGVGHSTEYGITSLYIDENDKLYTGEFDRVNFSTDNGVTWTSTHIWGSSSWVYSIVSKPDDLVIIGTYGNGIFRSIDGGLSFVAAGLAYQHVYALLRDSLGNIYAGSTGGFFKSTDDGITWQPHNNGLDGGSTILDLLLLGDKTILATSYSGFYFTEDQGDNWHKLNDGLLPAYVRSLALNINNTIYLGTNEGVYKFFGELPVEILSFSSAVIDNDVTLNWQTATEINNSGFEIEREQVFSQQSSISNGEWQTIGFIPGHGTTSEKQSYSFKDENLSSGKYQYRLKQIDYDGSFEYSNTIEVEITAPLEFSLLQNYPNPFNPTTKIKYTIPSVTLSLSKGDILVSLKVFDVLGNEVATLVNEFKPAGEYNIDFTAASLPSGVYFYQLKAGEFIQTRKMILIK
ncbi:MAG: T9SS type A sorting domain-containing protein [Ignavibacteriales bacterium]|nr:T9SS type A sorting domain-containing protein [Ignavibacteriales bacterium]